MNSEFYPCAACGGTIGSYYWYLQKPGGDLWWLCSTECLQTMRSRLAEGRI